MQSQKIFLVALGVLVLVGDAYSQQQEMGKGNTKKLNGIVRMEGIVPCRLPVTDKKQYFDAERNVFQFNAGYQFGFSLVTKRFELGIGFQKITANMKDANYHKNYINSPIYEEIISYQSLLLLPLEIHLPIHKSPNIEWKTRFGATIPIGFEPANSRAYPANNAVAKITRDSMALIEYTAIRNPSIRGGVEYRKLNTHKTYFFFAAITTEYTLPIYKRAYQNVYGSGNYAAFNDMGTLYFNFSVGLGLYFHPQTISLK